MSSMVLVAFFIRALYGVDVFDIDTTYLAIAWAAPITVYYLYKISAIVYLNVLRSRDRRRAAEEAWKSFTKSD